MKTTIDIPEKELQDAIRFSGAATKREAVLTALAEYNRRQRMARLARQLGTCKNMMTAEQLRTMREST
jgi:Arc/MetJ family transcription regulator